MKHRAALCEAERVLAAAGLGDGRLAQQVAAELKRCGGRGTAAHPLPPAAEVLSQCRAATGGDVGSQAESNAAAVVVRHSATLGTHVVAGRADSGLDQPGVAKGTTLVTETAVAAALTEKAAAALTHCHFCLELSPALLPCLHCGQAAYCSDACEHDAAKVRGGGGVQPLKGKEG